MTSEGVKEIAFYGVLSMLGLKIIWEYIRKLGSGNDERRKGMAEAIAEIKDGQNGIIKEVRDMQHDMKALELTFREEIGKINISLERKADKETMNEMRLELSEHKAKNGK